VIHTGVFYIAIGWLALLLGVSAILVARADTLPARVVALDLLILVLIGLLALVAGEEQRSYALDGALALALLSFVATLAAARYTEDRRPYAGKPQEERP
jgi:multicomponent Na+:H+ antiporter subunit F